VHPGFEKGARSFGSQDKQECLCHLRRIAIRIHDDKDVGEG
jgi:hypothetical protein